MKDKTNKLYNIDNIEFLKTLHDNSVSALITDCPYGLQKINALKLIKENTNNTRGFMNKAWDCLPTIDFLKECNRVLKDGAFFVTTFSPRQDLQCVFSYRLLEAGFDINFTPILWAFCQGFTKASDYQKVATKRGATEQTSEYLDGLKSCQLKPAYEVVIIAQKPYKAKSKIDQALVWYNERKELLDKGIKEEDLYLYTKNASGGVRVDKNDMFGGAMSSRIPLQDDDYLQNGITNRDNSQLDKNGNWGFKRVDREAGQGRFPATILVENNCLDVGRETKSVERSAKYNKQTEHTNTYTPPKTQYSSASTHADQGDLSRYFSIDAWTKKNLPELYKISKKTLELQDDAEKISPFLFTSKADKGSKNAGLEGQNTHCCGKPISLYAYLINLFTFPHDLVLDPYCGSGTTPIACVLTNRHYTGLELEKEYFDIAEARVKHWQEQKEYQKNKTLKEEGTLI